MQPTDTPESPDAYCPSGRLHLARTLFGSALLLASAAALAALSRDEIEGFGSFPFVTSGLPGMLGFAGAWLVVRFGACRNPGVGVLIGLTAGVLALFGGYHVDQCRRWGVGPAE